MKKLLILSILTSCSISAFADPRLVVVDSAYNTYVIYKDTQTGCQYIHTQDASTVYLQHTCDKEKDFE